MAAEPIARSSALGEQVANDLRRRIFTRELESGTSLVEAPLAGHYSVSRGPIRDAISILQREGLIETSGRSARVVGLTPHDVDELFALRAAVERLALEAAQRENLDLLVKDLESVLTTMRSAVEAKDTDAFTRADLDFHSAFGRSSGLRRVHDVWTQYQRTFENLLLVANLDHADLAPALLKHEQLAEMIAHGNREAALAELHHHLDSSRRRVREDFTTDPADA